MLSAVLCTQLKPSAFHIFCHHIPHPQVLFRVALALLKLHEPLLLAQDNPGELLQVTRRAAAEAFDRDALMKVGARLGAVVGAGGRRLGLAWPACTAVGFCEGRCTAPQ